MFKPHFFFSCIKILPNFVEALILVWLLYILSKLATVIYYPCLKKQRLETLLYLSFSMAPYKRPSRYFFHGFKIY